MIDIIVLIGLILSITLGFKDGLTRKLYGVLGVFGGLILGMLALNYFGNFFANVLGASTDIGRVAAFASTFVVFVLLINILYRNMGGTKDKAISVMSRFTGGVIGAFQGAIAISLMLMLVNKIGFFTDQDKQDSMLYERFYHIAPTMLNYTMKWLPEAQKMIDDLTKR